MRKNRTIILAIFVCKTVFFSAQDWTHHKGIYGIYETVSYQTKLNQKVISSGFDEAYQASINSFPSVKLGYSYTSWGNLGIFSDWTVWGFDFGAGISYSKSVMNGYAADQNYYNDPVFEETSPNYTTFFNYYQPGNACLIDDYGVNLHFDVGTILYAGVELDAGPSRIRFTDNRIQGQKVNSLGWFANGRIQGGISIPLPFRLDSYVKINCKAYGIFYGWSGRFYKLDWFAEDKKLKNFSTLKTNGTPLGLGLSLSLLFED